MTRIELGSILPATPLGAIELSTFARLPDNDNDHIIHSDIDDGRQSIAQPSARVRIVGLPLPVVAFACGLTAALMLAGIGRAIGLIG